MKQLIEWLAGRNKPLSQLSRSELRRKELMLEKDRARLLNRIKKIAAQKQDVFQKGSKEKEPEVRRAYAQEFELKTTEQLMVARQLNIRSKEHLTVSRLRMLKENVERSRNAGSQLGMVSEKDILKIGKLIETDSIKTEVYQERLDELLRVGSEVDEGSAALSQAGSAVMGIWDKMDDGTIDSMDEAFDEADRRVRDQQKSAAEEA